MALRVWLPLTGTLENKGISNVTKVSGTPSYKSGKIGANSLNLNNRITFDCAALANLQTFSICFWGMSETSSTLTANWMDLMGFTDISSGGSSGTFRWETGYNGNNGIHWHDNATNAMVSGSHNHITSHGVWKHCCVVFNYEMGKIYSYDDGILTQTHNHAGGHFNSTGRFYLGETNNIEGRITDVRIYDHALSNVEVKEISQGLVLHYKLDSFVGNSGNPNLYTGSRDFSGSWVNGSNWTTATEAYSGFVVKQRSATWGGLCQNVPCAQNDIFTVSFFGKVDSGGNIQSVHRSNLGNVTTGLTILDGNFSSGTIWVQNAEDGTQWKRYWATVKITGSDVTYLQWRIENSVSGKNLYVCGMKLEKGSSATNWTPALSEGSFNTIQDSSGYGHNGSIYGTTQLISGSPRYSIAIELTSTSSHINASGLVTSGFGSSYSFVWWAKSNSTTNMHWGFSDGIRLNGLYNGNLWNTGDSSDNPLYKPGTTTGISVTEANVWHHWAMTGDGITCKVYKDGVHVANAKTWKAISGTSLWFNGWQNATNYAASSLALSDFRLYATALSADDIKQLYNVSAKVDNLQNLHTFELIENQPLIKITKNGQAKCKEITETTKTSFRKDKDIYTNNLIER